MDREGEIRIDLIKKESIIVPSINILQCVVTRKKSAYICTDCRGSSFLVACGGHGESFLRTALRSRSGSRSLLNSTKK